MQTLLPDCRSRNRKPPSEKGSEDVSGVEKGLFRVSYEKLFTTEAQNSQSSENVSIKNSLSLRPEPVLSDVEGRLRGAILRGQTDGADLAPFSVQDAVPTFRTGDESRKLWY